VLWNDTHTAHKEQIWRCRSFFIFHFTCLFLTKLQSSTSENVNQLDDQQVSGWFHLTDIINEIKKKWRTRLEEFVGVHVGSLPRPHCTPAITNITFIIILKLSNHLSLSKKSLEKNSLQIFNVTLQKYKNWKQFPSRFPCAKACQKHWARALYVLLHPGCCKENPRNSDQVAEEWNVCELMRFTEPRRGPLRQVRSREHTRAHTQNLTAVTSNIETAEKIIPMNKQETSAGRYVSGAFVLLLSLDLERTNFPKIRTRLEVLSCWIVTWSKSQTRNPQICATVENIVATAKWRLGFVNTSS
jgi:hypothetical protein